MNNLIFIKTKLLPRLPLLAAAITLLAAKKATGQFCCRHWLGHH
jgi:hypothetical protein